MDIEIHTNNNFLMFEVFETKSLSFGNEKEILKGVKLRYEGGVFFKNTEIPGILKISLDMAGDVATGLIAAWLYDKLKNSDIKKLVIGGKKTPLSKEDIEKSLKNKKP